MSKKGDVIQFIAVFVENAVQRGERGLVAGGVARSIMRHAATHNRLSTEHCNRSLTEKEKKRLVKVESDILGLCKLYEVKPRFSGDPRGYTVKLLFSSGQCNTWGGKEDGWGVPV